MAGLLSDAEDREIRDAVKLVTDTFMVTPVIYKRLSEAIDRFEEDREGIFVDYNLLGLEEAAQTGGDVMKEFVREGSRDDNDVTLSFNFEDMETAGLIEVDYGHKIQIETDYFILKGKVFKINDAYLDGPLSAKNCLLIMKGKISDKRF